MDASNTRDGNEITDAQRLVVQEQVIDDPVSNLVLQFRRTENGEGRLHIWLPEGHEFAGCVRDFQFSADGLLAGTGMATRPIPKDEA